MRLPPPSLRHRGYAMTLCRNKKARGKPALFRQILQIL
jgi:hypothetical protein